MQLDGTWDIETQDWTTFVMGGLWDGRTFAFSQDEDQYFDLLCAKEGVWWAHNGGKFDILWFYSVLRRRKIRPTRIDLQGSRVLRLVLSKLVLQDSYALIPMGLDRAGGMVRDQKDVLPFPYSEIQRGMSPERMKVLIDYLQKDCTLLWDVLTKARTFCAENDLVPKGTVGATAWASAQKELGIPPSHWDSHRLWKYTRKGYYGGRAEVFRTEAPSGFRYDRNSSYPAALVRTALPVGQMKLVAKPRTAANALDKFEGVYSATVQVPMDTHIPVLPARVKTENNRLIFPVGRVSGQWTGLELRYAAEQGCKIQRIHSALVWKQSRPVLAQWCQRLWDLRASAETEALGRWLKWILNSLTGKLGERADKRVCVELQPGDKPVPCRATGTHPEGTPCPITKCCQHRCVGDCKGWKALDFTLNLWDRPVWFIPKNSYPHWAAYLTAEARISLHKQLVGAGSDVVYCDTDSVYSTSELTEDLGEGLGQWKTEGPFENWRAIAPKLYRYHDPASGRTVVRGKGFRGLDDNGFQELAEGKPVNFGTQPNTFRLGLKSEHGVFSKRKVIKQTRGIPGLCGTRLIEKDGSTSPLTIRAFAEMNKRR